ncbi:MAG TPA: NUDIX domain-containing protein [Candidatus Norongarragalinales archaeon]|nr:NUDIX domain-containing protein [Candidatus Norongarragalinales archaeon]
MVENRKSVGVVIFRVEKGLRKYLVLHYAAGHWDFPKGGKEAGESDDQTFRRELLEETGITQLDIVPGFHHEFTYFFREKGQLVLKTVFFHLARTDEKIVRLSFEDKDFAWLPFEEAKTKLTHKNAKELLEKADAFLET